MSLRADIQDRYVTANGYRIRYIEKGAGRPLVCLHGLDASLSADQWLANIDVFSQVARVIALDMPGYGLSDLPASGYSFPMLVQTVKAFCDALGLREVDLMGQSLGGWIAGLTAHQHPGLVRRLVLVSNAGLNPPLNPYGANFNLPDRNYLRTRLLGEWGDPKLITDEVIEELYRRTRLPGREAAYRALLRAVEEPKAREEFSLRQRLPEMRLPILVAQRDNNRGVPLRYALEAFHLAPNARLVIAYGSGPRAAGFSTPEFEQAAIAFLTAAEVPPAK